MQTPLHKPRLSRGDTVSSPVTSTGAPLLLVDREGAYHVFNRGLSFYHSASLDSYTWTPWQMISEPPSEVHWPRALSALQDKDGVFWLAIKANRMLPDNMTEELGDIWLGRVKRFDEWGLAAE